MWKQAECGKCGELFDYRQQAMCPNCGASANFFVEPLDPDTLKDCTSCEAANRVGRDTCWKCGLPFRSILSENEKSAMSETCNVCEIQIPNMAKFCPACGTAVQRKVESFYCIECGKENPKNRKKCKDCGEPQATFSELTLMECTHTDFLPGRTPDGSRICKQCKARISDPNAVESLQIENPSVKNESNNGKYIWGGVAVLLILLLLAFASKGSGSYKIGYQAGKELSANNSFLDISGQPIDICDSVLNLSLAGSPNDNINWSNVNKHDFDRGCLDAYADTHDGMTVKTEASTPLAPSPASTAGSGYLTSSDTSILNEDGASRIDNAALQRLVVAGGIHPDFSSGDGTLKAYADALYAVMQQTANQNGLITEKDMEVQIQPGLGLNTLINNLFPGSAGAVFDEFRAEAARDEANGVTYESYR